MAGLKSKNKGASYERKVAKILGEWSGLDLRRTPLSGGWARQNPNASGDVISITEGVRFPFSVECKNNEAWNLEAIVRGNCKAFEMWWEQACTGCPKGRIPMLVFSKAYSDDWVVLNSNEIDRSKFSTCIIIGARVIVRLQELISVMNFGDFAERTIELVQQEGAV